MWHIVQSEKSAGEQKQLIHHLEFVLNIQKSLLIDHAPPPPQLPFLFSHCKQTK